MTERTHVLKTTPSYFALLWSGAKTFEIRLDDRGYQKGDRVVLREYDFRNYSGREVHAVVGCVIASTPDVRDRRGFRGNGFVVFSLTQVERVEPLETAPAEKLVAAGVDPAEAVRAIHEAAQR